MMTRRLHITLHWSIVLLILSMVKGGTAATGVRWAFAACVALWVALALIKGLRSKPGPKLGPSTRAAYPWLHRGLYIMLALSAALNAAELTGLLAPGPAWNSLLILMALGAAHGLFHLWRHTALYDNALRPIIPRFLHHVL